MKLQCIIARNDRQLPTLALQSSRPQTSTLSVGQVSTGGDACILHQTQSNTTGTVYKVKGNITKVFTKFIHEGKATVSFSNPPHDLIIKANDPLQLKSFLRIIKSILQGKELSKGGGGLSTLVPGRKLSKPLVTKLSITRKEKYPVLEGFPRTLVVLEISDIEQSRFDERILKLKNLKKLDLTSNHLKFLPSGLGTLPHLAELILKKNNLGYSSHQLGGWDWMRGKSLINNLQSLDLSSNNIPTLPSFLTDMRSLVNLKVDHNELTSLPSGMGQMESLRFLSVSYNELDFLPGSMLKMYLCDLDTSSNPFKGITITTQCIQPQVLPLKELAAREVIRLRIPLNEAVLPATLLRFMQGCDFCVCGNACFNPTICKIVLLDARKIAASLSLLAGESSNKPFRLCVCSDRCVHGKFSYLVK